MDGEQQTIHAGGTTEEAFRAILRTFGLIKRNMEPYFSGYGISGAQWGVLRVLHRAEDQGEEGLRLTDLGNRLLVRPPSITTVVDRLERQGLVARRASTTDRRAKTVSLSPAGRELVARILEVHPARIRAILGGLSLEEQAQLLALLGRLQTHMEGLLEQSEHEESETHAVVGSGSE
jgi:MarR family 2-MHQ and catechol resistance regulon transcriptional repressor